MQIIQESFNKKEQQEINILASGCGCDNEDRCGDSTCGCDISYACGDSYSCNCDD